MRISTPHLNFDDSGKNAVIQSGWDIHPDITNIEKIGKIITSPKKNSLS